MIYLAQPYSHPDLEVREARYEEALRYCAILHTQHIYSPIVHWHNVAERHNLPGDARYWELMNCHMLDLARRMLVLQLDGWRTSAGLRAELIFCRDKGKPVGTIHPTTHKALYTTPTDLLKEMEHGEDSSEREHKLLLVKGDVPR